MAHFTSVLRRIVRDVDYAQRRALELRTGVDHGTGVITRPDTVTAALRD